MSQVQALGQTQPTKRSAKSRRKRGIEQAERLLEFTNQRWTAAEIHYGKCRGKQVARQEARCEFWRSLHRALEDVVASTQLTHLARSTTSPLVEHPTFCRPPQTDLPENFPDLPYSNLGVPLVR